MAKRRIAVVPDMRVLASALVTLLVAACCSSAAEKTPKGEALNFRTLAAGEYGAGATSDRPLQQSTVIVATDETTYRSHWRDVVGDSEPPAVDFSKESVILLSLGRRSTGGYAVRPMAVLADGDVARVNTIVERPEKGGIAAMVITSPYVAIAIPRKGITSAEWFADNDHLIATSRPPVK